MTATKEYFRCLLQEADLQVKFKKKDGTEREMLCTLRHDALPPISKEKEKEANSKTKKENANALAVWDLEKNAFRSFRIDSILSFRQVS
jgi:hypothetical protein